NRQWFNFRVESTAGVPHRIEILEAGDSTSPKGWNDYQVLATYDQSHGFQVETEYDGHSLRINHTPDFNQVNYATTYTTVMHDIKSR
ncbi:MAG: phage-related tail fiber protein, partial [Gammaproteobacteria bacterium]